MMEFPYDAVVFDVDGTLLRSADGILYSCLCALKELGYTPLPEDEQRKMIGPPLHYFFETYMGMTSAQAEEATTCYRKYYRSEGMFKSAIYPGLRALLRTLKKSGVYTAIATGKPQSMAEKIMADYGMTPFFDKVVGISDDNHAADKKDMITRALPEKYKHAVMVGDRLFDINGARDAGIDSIGVLYGYGSREELEENKATHIVETVDDLFAFLCPGAQKPDGLFISVEGLDGSGKTTQADMLEEHLLRAGFDVKRTREPGGCPIAEKIRSLVLDVKNVGMTPVCEALLYAAARAQHVEEIIKPGIHAGKLVLCDRFVDSSVCYQGGGRKLGVQLVEQINAPAVEGMLPGITLYMDIDHLTALSRRRAATGLDRIEMEEADFHGRVEDAYHQLEKMHPERFVSVDASGTPQQVAALAWQALLPMLYKMEAK